MDEIVIDAKKLERARRRKEWEEKLKDRANRVWSNTVNFARQYPEYAFAIAAGVGGTALSIINAAMKTHRLNVEKHNKECFWYDPSLGHYWELRRKLTAAEARTVDARHQNGERLGDIFADLHMLK